MPATASPSLLACYRAHLRQHWLEQLELINASNDRIASPICWGFDCWTSGVLKFGLVYLTTVFG